VEEDMQRMWIGGYAVADESHRFLTIVILVFL
jgi:hypothetical protein